MQPADRRSAALRIFARAGVRDAPVEIVEYARRLGRVAEHQVAVANELDSDAGVPMYVIRPSTLTPIMPTLATGGVPNRTAAGANAADARATEIAKHPTAP